MTARSSIPLGHTIPAHRVFGWCAYCSGRTPAEELAAWQTRELRRLADEAQQQPDTETRDALMRAHVALAEQAGQDQATLARVRRLYESGPLGTCCAHLVGAALSGPGRVADEEQGETCGCRSESAVAHQFGSEDCTCIPFIRERGQTRYCKPGDTVDQISGWEIGRDCLHHQYAIEAPR